ncbi:MAG: hypothetical protein IJ668_12830 [Selenomonadaceae bacterium]|nr:hypothetical protein [Selenomonadaceae bacterium]
MNEKGFASLTALMVLLMLAYLIRGTDYTAGLFVEMTNNFETENRLRLVAESVLAGEIVSFDGKTVDDVKAALQSYPKSLTRKGVSRILVNYNLLPNGELLLLVVVSEDKYFNEQFGAFYSVAAFFEPNGDGNYKFKGYVYKGV